MSTQKFSAAQREAIWIAYNKKCAYTSELLDISNFHIDHIIPESLADNPVEFDRVRTVLGLPEDFDLYGYGNLLPCRPGANLKKGAQVLDLAHTHFFLGIASSRIAEIIANLDRIEKRKNAGKALILLQQCLEKGELSPSDIANILTDHVDEPEEIFHLIERMEFSDATDVQSIAKAEIEDLRNRPIKFGPNDHIDGVTLTNHAGEQVYVKTCREFQEAIESGYHPETTFGIKVSSHFVQMSGLLRHLQVAASPLVSFLENPRVGIVDLTLLPFSLFPILGDESGETSEQYSYQDKVADGTIIINGVRQNSLWVQEPEGMGQHLVEVVRADFTGDGIEDILLFEYCYATHGTLGYGGIRILTRKAQDKLFEIVPSTHSAASIQF